MTQETLVLGGGPTGLEVATGLAAQNVPVTLVAGQSTARRARRAGLPAHESSLETATLPVDCSASTVVVATPADRRNLLLAAAAPRAFDADRVVALVNDPDRQAVFDDAGIETICVSTVLAEAVTDAVTTTGSVPVDTSPSTADRTRVSD